MEVSNSDTDFISETATGRMGERRAVPGLIAGGPNRAARTVLPHVDSVGVWLRVQASRVAHAFVRLAREREELLAAQAMLQADIAARRLDRSGSDSYAEANEVNTWRRHEDVFDRGVFGNDCIFRNEYMRDELKRMDVNTVINFGGLYGWLDHELHKAGKEVWSVDRSAETKRLNENKFPGPHFVASDIRDFLKAHSFSDAAFVHINTGTFLLPQALTDIYRAALAAGCRYVLLFEPSCVSRITGRYFPYDASRDEPSIVLRGTMLAHNYPRLLSGAGFATRRLDTLRPPHPHRDFRSIFLLAERALDAVSSPPTVPGEC